MNGSIRRWGEEGAFPVEAPVTTPPSPFLTGATMVPTTNANVTMDILEIAEETHEFDAVATLTLNVALIGCLLLAYYVKQFRIYYLPESAGALIVGMFLGGIARLSTDKFVLFEFSPEIFFFVLLPPIIFEAGYSLKRQDFFNNIGAITLYAMVGTMISTFVVGGLAFYAARSGLIRDVDDENPWEALLFGALISAVDPVATLSIMGNEELRCDPLLYSLVFGESVLNDAVAISLFKVFAKYYEPSGPRWKEANIPSALLSFVVVSLLSILVGVALGLAASFLYKNTNLSSYPKFETSLLFSFCYLCYATGESLGLSGIMALFFQGIVLAHYNSYNLSSTAHVASEHIFQTLATVAETAVFLYMGAGVFTGRFKNYDVLFSVLSLIFCALGRFFNIFPLSWVANLCRNSSNRIRFPMQCVLWFAGLRGAVAFALAMNMPGPNREVYATATLFICIFTTVVCGGYTDRMLTDFGMKEEPPHHDDEIDGIRMNRLTYQPARGATNHRLAHQARKRVYQGAKKLWKQLDDDVLKVYFGGANMETPSIAHDELGSYELGRQRDSDDDVDEDANGEHGTFIN